MPIPIFLINLDRSKDRLAYMRRQAAELGLQMERLPAVEGRNVPEWLRSEFTPSTRMSDGEVGCYASHLVAARTIVARDLPYAIVLEDDAELSAGFNAIAARAVASVPADWDYLHLCTRFKKTVVRVVAIDGEHSLVRYPLPPSRTAAYILSNAGARKWLAPMQRVRAIDLDNRFAWQQDLKVYGVFPAIAEGCSGSASTVRAKAPKRQKPSFPSMVYGMFWSMREIGITIYLKAMALDAVNSLRKHATGVARVSVIDNNLMH
ncbi:hypothetical protein HYPP_01759 [Hyphomicrobium sp. ghe19]|nr:hypothetical protein HYPP_01759 [Hyphomicrobium sp. ghe19]